MPTHTIPAVDSAVGNSNADFPRYDGLYNQVPSCAYTRPAYLSSRYDRYNPDGTGLMSAWTFAALAFRQDDLAFLDDKKILSIQLRLRVLSASPSAHAVSAYCPAGATFTAGAASGACAFTSASGADLLPLAESPTSLEGWLSFTVPSLAVLKGVVQRGVRVDDGGASQNPQLATYFTAYPHSHASYAPYLEVQYEDEFTPPACQALEPAATMVDADGPVTFRWSYAQAVNSPQSHVSLQVCRAGGAWQSLLAQHPTSQQTYTAQEGLALRGECQWRVQVFCNGGAVASPWSGAKSFLAAGSPLAPTITGVSPTPVCTVTWQQDEDQTGYELYLDGPGGPLWHSGQRLSQARSLTLPLLLEDGPYTLRLRTLGAQGRWGPWASASVLVQNAPAGAVQASLEAAGGGLLLRWSPTASFDGYAILRGGRQVARLGPDARQYLDREALGRQRYVVRGLAGPFYTDSAPLAGTCTVAHAVIGGQTGDFIPLQMRRDKPPAHRHSRSAPVRCVQYEGAALPTAYRSTGQQRTHALAFTVPQRAHYAALLALVGQPVLYKDNQGDVFAGVLNSVTADSGAAAGFDVTLELTETREVAGHG